MAGKEKKLKELQSLLQNITSDKSIDSLIALNDISRSGDYYDLGSMERMNKLEDPLAMGANPLFQVMTKTGEPRYISQGFTGYPSEERYDWAQNMARGRLERNPADTLSTQQMQELLRMHGQTLGKDTRTPTIAQKLGGYIKGLFSK